MRKIIKKTLIGGSSLIGISLLFWLVLLLNPSLSYGNHTDIGNVRIHHNEALAPEMKMIIQQSMEIVKQSELYDADESIDLCLNDDSYVNFLKRLSHGGIAATLLNKVGIFEAMNPAENHVFWRWNVNNNELRKWDLVELIAHEMTHAYQYNQNVLMPIQLEHWKAEGYAEYIARVNRRDLKTNILRLIEAEKEAAVGIPWIVFEDRTGTSRFYFQNWLMMEYMMTVKNMTYLEVTVDEMSLEEVKSEMIIWANK